MAKVTKFSESASDSLQISASANEKGFLEKCTRPSSKGQKVFNHLTTKGLAYGENQVSPNNPKETQPLYYEGKFSQLLTEVGLR